MLTEGPWQSASYDGECSQLAQAVDTYLHRVGRAGRFGTKGIAVSFVSSERDEAVLKAIEARFEKKVDEYKPELVELKPKE